MVVLCIRIGKWQQSRLAGLNGNQFAVCCVFHLQGFIRNAKLVDLDFEVRVFPLKTMGAFQRCFLYRFSLFCLLSKGLRDIGSSKMTPLGVEGWVKNISMVQPNPLGSLAFSLGLFGG